MCFHITLVDDIRNYFNKFGQVVEVSIKYDAVTGNPRGFGFITFGTNECIDNVSIVIDMIFNLYSCLNDVIRLI